MKTTYPRMLQEANRILNKVKDGQDVELWLIQWALRMTGDL
jgi:hypothetical protein